MKKKEVIRIIDEDIIPSLSEIRSNAKKTDDTVSKLIDLCQKLSADNIKASGKIETLETELEQLRSDFDTYRRSIEISKGINTENESEVLSGETSSGSQPDLADEKKEIFNIMENTSNNLFVTGKAGTGKSYLLKHFKINTNKKVLFTAPTGVAALNIGGVTIHSAFGFNNLKDGAQIRLSDEKKKCLTEIDTLVIDEISMVRVDVFNQIDLILKKVNDNNQPFGGKQIIVFGDVFQLPPVTDSSAKTALLKKYGGIFFFNSPAYANGIFFFRELNKIYRQDENETVFKNILNNIREGKIHSSDIKELNKHYYETPPEGTPQIVCKRETVNIINNENLSKLRGKEYVYEAEITSTDEKPIAENDFPCPSSLKLKAGALVMMVANDNEYHRWVNGTIGVVRSLSNNQINVAIEGKEYSIAKTKFAKTECYIFEGELRYKEIASMTQFPLVLAYAVTIHKSQGKTYNRIACDLNGCFAPGQAYVALSRCSNFKQLYLLSKIESEMIMTDKEIVAFYEHEKNKSDPIPEHKYKPNINELPHFDLSNIVSVKNTKPLKIAINKDIIKEKHWSKLLESVVRYGYQEYEIEEDLYSEKYSLKQENHTTGEEYIHQCFIKGATDKPYSYIKDLNVSVFSHGADDIVKVIRIFLCDYIKIEEKNIIIYYK